MLRELGSWRRIVPLMLLAILSVPIWAQGPRTQTPPNPGGYVFHSNTREVLTDVTVTDRHGNPIDGLSRSAFHIFDNERPQQLESFEEHAGAPATVAATGSAPNVFSNSYLQHLPPSLNVILIDTTTIDIVDQMVLNQQLMRFVNALPVNQSLAIYQRAVDGTILQQNFTSDHNLLLTAIHRAIPHLRQPGAWQASDFGTLEQMAAFLSQMPGRKNVLWFTGGSNLFLKPDPSVIPPSQLLREIYDELETERIALYPIDARGLTVAINTAMAPQHMLMTDMADATGGQAWYDNNGLAQIASHTVDTDSHFYTLTYRPDNLKANNKWHKVKIAVDGGPYHLSYRQLSTRILRRRYRYLSSSAQSENDLACSRGNFPGSRSTYRADHLRGACAAIECSAASRFIPVRCAGSRAKAERIGICGALLCAGRCAYEGDSERSN